MLFSYSFIFCFLWLGRRVWINWKKEKELNKRTCLHKRLSLMGHILSYPCNLAKSDFGKNTIKSYPLGDLPLLQVCNLAIDRKYQALIFWNGSIDILMSLLQMSMLIMCSEINLLAVVGIEIHFRKCFCTTNCRRWH